MKTQFLSISILFIGLFANAQLCLTKAINQPVLGDVNTKQLYDSVGIIVPKSVGTNQVWDFSGFSMTSSVEVSNYISVSSAPNGSSYSGTTFVESFSQTYFYMKAGTTKYEIVGIQNPNFRLNFSSNNATQYFWSVVLGDYHSDAFSGTAYANNMNGTVSGNIESMAPGSGTLIIPGGGIFTGVLQVKIVLTAAASFAFGLAKANLKAVDYTYFDASRKFPLITVSYINVTGAYTSNTAVIKLNSSIVGINDQNFEASFKVFPNPAKSEIHVTLRNETNAICNVEIIDVLGQPALESDLGNETEISADISISDLKPGIYFVKTTLGDRQSIRKLIVE